MKCLSCTVTVSSAVEMNTSCSVLCLHYSTVMSVCLVVVMYLLYQFICSVFVMLHVLCKSIHNSKVYIFLVSVCVGAQSYIVRWTA